MTDTKTPPPPPVPPFAPPPLEDRSKYEKLLSVDCSDVDEDGVDRKSAANKLDGVADDEARRTKMADSDSIGSATDLKNYATDDEDDATLQK